jgi:hypothetical protein
MKWIFWIILAAFLCACQQAGAFPPAPHHIIYGLARDQYGTPIMNSQAKVLLRTSDGVQVAANILPGLAVGINFAIEVPMDANIVPDFYKSNALAVATPYKLYVVLGAATNVPIQMTRNYIPLGQPAGQTRQDLTLGVDSVGDGIPDAWKHAFLASIGSNMDISLLKTNIDYAHDGRTLLQEFLLGNHPFNPDDAFSVRLVDPTITAPVLEFTTMTGRLYTVLGSSDLSTWTQLQFQLPADGANSPARSSYYAADIRQIQVRVIQPANLATMLFFRLQLQ